MVACVTGSAARHPDASADISGFRPALVVLLNSASFTTASSPVDGVGHVTLYNVNEAELSTTYEGKVSESSTLTSRLV
jgi:hypothetical protein